MPAVAPSRAYTRFGWVEVLLGLSLSVLSCKTTSNSPPVATTRTPTDVPIVASPKAKEVNAAPLPTDVCRTKAGQVVCDGKARVECLQDGLGKFVESCPEACADGVCTCAYGPEPTCTEQPTAPCTEQGPNVPIIDIAHGERHTCALLQGGCVRCWTGPLRSTGKEATPESLEFVRDAPTDHGHLGIPSRVRIGQTALSDVNSNVDVGGKAVAISVGNKHTCALLEGGCVRCWGDNKYGQLGQGNMEPIGDNETPRSVPPVSLGGPAKSIAVGYDFSCALMVGGDVRCWGHNDRGQLGLGHKQNIGDRQTPIASCPLRLGETSVELAVALTSACVILSSGHVRCWGHGSFGRLGQPEAEATYSPIFIVGDDEEPSSVPPLTLPGPVKHVALGDSHACAQLSSGLVYCWGDNSQYQLGVDLPKVAFQPLSTPLKVSDIRPEGFSVGAGFTCATNVHGQVFCIGSGPSREVPRLNALERTVENGGIFPGFHRVKGIANPMKLLQSPYFLRPCALVSKTTIRCW